MIQLEQDVVALRRLLDPMLAAKDDFVILSPEESDENFTFKREVYTKARDILAAGQNAINGARYKVPQFDDLEFQAVDSYLTDDQLREEWVELAKACRRVVHSLDRIAV